MAVDCGLCLNRRGGVFLNFAFKRVHLSVQSKYALFPIRYVYHPFVVERSGGGIFRIPTNKQFIAIIRSAQRGNRVFALVVSSNGWIYCRGNLEQRKNFNSKASKTDKNSQITYTTRMKTIKLRSSIFAMLAALLFMFPWWSAVKTQPLSDITKPYFGTYECRLAQLNEKNLLDDFSYIRLELKTEKEYALYAKTKDGAEKRVKGDYIYNEERQTITFYADTFSFVKKEFPMKQGEINICLKQGDKTLLMKFVQI